MAHSPRIGFRAPSETVEAIEAAARINGRNVSAELRAAVDAHLAAVGADLKDHEPGGDPARGERTGMESEVAA